MATLLGAGQVSITDAAMCMDDVMNFY